MQFFNGLDHDIRRALRAQLRDLWTHTSTALEGNTLTLGETSFVVMEYLRLLAAYELATGAARRGESLLPQPERLGAFRQFCRECWQATLALVETARRLQAARTLEHADSA